MKYILILIIILEMSGCRMAGLVSFCGLMEEETPIRWQCTKSYRDTGEDRHKLNGYEDLISCHKLGLLPWYCTSTVGGLTVPDPIKYQNDRYFVII